MSAPCITFQKYIIWTLHLQQIIFLMMCKCYVGLKDAVEVQQPLSYRELAELFRTSTCFLNYRDTHGRKRG